MENWIYFGVFLDDISREKLNDLALKVVEPDWKLFCHHMTIAFNDGSEKAQHAYDNYKRFFGKSVDIYATHIGKSKDAIALKVDYKYGTLTSFPHITLATPQGGKPVNSNYITNWTELNKPIKLTGIIKSFNKK
jgi:hypothetical protein